ANPEDGRELRVCRSSDRGDSWEDIPVSRPLRGNYEPQGVVVSDSGAITVGWLWTSRSRPGGQIRHVVLTTSDGGRTWDEAELHALDKGVGEVPEGLSEANRTGPALAMDRAGTAHAAFVRFREGNTRFDAVVRSSEDLRRWSEAVVLTRDDGSR